MVAVTLEVLVLLKSSLICIVVQQTCAEAVVERGRNPDRVGGRGVRGFIIGEVGERNERI